METFDKQRDSSVPCGFIRRTQSGIAGRNNTEEDLMALSHENPAVLQEDQP